MKLYDTGWHGSYGGQKYKVSCENARTLLDAIMLLLDSDKDNRSDAFNAVIEWANKTENNVHNTGYFFNKFMSKQALDWGTDTEKISPKLNLFNVFYAGKAALDVRKDKLPKLLDTTSIIDYAMLRWSPSAQKNNPIWLDGKAPQLVKDVVEDAVKNGRHMVVLHNGHQKHTTPSDTKNYIMCGHDDCSYCKEFVKKSKSAPLLIDEAYQMIAVMDTGVEYDMILPLSNKVQDDSFIKGIDKQYLTNQYTKMKQNGSQYWVEHEALQLSPDLPMTLFTEMTKIYTVIQVNHTMPVQIDNDLLKLYTKVIALMPNDVLKDFSNYAIKSISKAVNEIQEEDKKE
tara:strand:- start:70 stop:1095 length:1026 start_codon:yes stop_codon:yes gene_type:complete